MTDGGDGTPAGFRRTQEHKDKIAAKLRLRTGGLNHNFGKSMSKEQKKKISKALSGRPLSEETKKKMSEFQLKRAAEGKGKQADDSVYSFERLADGFIVNCTRAELGLTFNLKLHIVNGIFRRGRNTSGGWRLFNKHLYLLKKDTNYGPE